MNKYVYIATNPCGCITGAVMDGTAHTADDVAEFIRSGRAVNRVKLEEGETVDLKHCECPKEDLK